ncbi:MAG: DUF3857 domain-containing protein, partial [Chitinophagaceae bacterium]
MRKMYLPVFLFFCVSSAIAQNNYSIISIDSTLFKEANVVLRYDDNRYEMKSLEKAVEYCKYAITILNEKGDEHSGLVVPYDRFNSIDYIEGTLYDAFGKKIRSLKKGDIKDLTGSGYSLADDDRYKEHNFYHRVYPYTVEYEYAVIRKETMFFPRWFPQTDELYAVQESKFTVIVPAAYKFRYKAFNYPGQPEVTTQGDKTTYQWSAKKLPAIRYTFGFPGWKHISPMVVTGPTDFQIEEYKGNMGNWQDYGKFIQTLNQGRDVLPDVIKAQVQSVVNGKKTPREKVEALYDFLQKNTRYISVQLGVGGWRPFDASYVAKNRYGDCKALSNYMYSLLKEAGIPSYYTLIRAGENVDDIVPDFPSSQFNHAILCVPLENDSMWLECTSQDQVPGYMGSFTGNRHAVIITPEGGKLVGMPVYGLKENQQVTRIKATVDENGNMMVDQSADYSGLMQDDYHDMINNLSKEKLKEYLGRQIDLATFDIVDFHYTQDRKKVPVMHEALKLSVSNYAQISGKRIFVNPNVSNRVGTKLLPQERKYPLLLRTAYVQHDSVEITVPAGYKPEAVPAPIQVESKFGKYSGNYKVEGNKVIYYRRFERYNGLFESSFYPELVKFYEQIYKGDRSRV